jgi:hypothetical protein
MIPRVVEVKALPGYKLWLRFQDGVTGLVDLSAELWGPMFEPLKDPGFFERVSLNQDLDTVTWPNGADFAPEFLYGAVQQRISA